MDPWHFSTALAHNAILGTHGSSHSWKPMALARVLWQNTEGAATMMLQIRLDMSQMATGTQSVAVPDKFSVSFALTHVPIGLPWIQ